MRCIALLLFATLLGGCIQTKMQSYADRELPQRPITRVVAYVSAPVSIANELQDSLSSQAAKYGIVSDNALYLFPPTRTYSQQEIQRDLAARGIDGVLLVNVGDTGIIKEYAGTFFSGTYSARYVGGSEITRQGNALNVSTVGFSNGSWSGSAEPEYRARRSTRFTAKLIEASSGRVLWTGEGQVNASGYLFVGDQAGASSTAAAIFEDLRAKKLL
jgi:hypothetical protein